MEADEQRLKTYVDVWADAVQAVVVLLRSLGPEDWDRPTDLPGWDVRAVVAHLAHLESELAGNAQAAVDVPELEHVRSPMGVYTESGRLARASASPDELVDELVAAADTRLRQLRTNPPTDGATVPEITPGGIGWSWETLLSNRPLDLWMHEQDIRRAVGLPGGFSTPAAAHTVEVFTRAFGYVVGKRVAPPAGTTVVLDVRGVHPVHLAVETGEDGRARPVMPDPEKPAVTLGMDLETFVLLSGGRRAPEQVAVVVDGDEELGRRVLAAMAVTP